MIDTLYMKLIFNKDIRKSVFKPHAKLLKIFMYMFLIKITFLSLYKYFKIYLDKFIQSKIDFEIESKRTSLF